MISGRKVFVVEDDQYIKMGLKDFLESEGYCVEVFSNGKLALEQLKQANLPALLLLDMIMPVMGGREFLDIVQKDKSLATIPIVVISATAKPQEIEGAQEFLKKPLDLDHLLGLVKKYCEE